MDLVIILSFYNVLFCQLTTKHYYPKLKLQTISATNI